MHAHGHLEVSKVSRQPTGHLCTAEITVSVVLTQKSRSFPFPLHFLQITKVCFVALRCLLLCTLHLMRQGALGYTWGWSGHVLLAL